MNEKINMAIADATRGKLRLENCDSLVKQAAAHQNVLLPAMERIGQALNFGQMVIISCHECHECILIRVYATALLQMLGRSQSLLSPGGGARDRGAW